MAPLPAGQDKVLAYDTLFTRDTLAEYDKQYEKTYSVHERPEFLSACKRGLIQRGELCSSSWTDSQLRGPYDNRPPPPGQPPDYWEHRRPAPLYIPDYSPTSPPAHIHDYPAPKQPPSPYNYGYPQPHQPAHIPDYPPRPAPQYDPGYPPAQQLPAVHNPQVDQTPGHVPPKPAAPSLAEKAGGVHNMVYIGGVIGAVVLIGGAIFGFKKWMTKRKEKKEAEGGGDGGGDDAGGDGGDK
ncbi:hypothetical protein NW768_011376 [Fusarium equiseti]|uniref:Uncharacterized protein n=1 Tax=Fusarium equiseti TaxID=61235 RepID=A0ABQ8QYJ8_FUSEQ|nr:hypothetical protein NW768_011376 [Fusarium equiseti]